VTGLSALAALTAGTGLSGAGVVISGALCGAGLAGLVWAWRSPAETIPIPSRRDGSTGPDGGPERPTPAGRRRPRVPRQSSGRSLIPLALSVVAGVLVGVATGWPVAVPLAALAAYGLPGLFGRTSGAVSIEKIEAIATWTEMLQSTLAASAGLGEAIMATAPLSPPVLRQPAARLSARLAAGMDPAPALHQFADEIDDPCADRVVCALQLAMSARAQRVGDLLSALADSTREEVALRLRVETSRASVRSGVRTVLVFSVAFAAGLVVVAHSYLAPFGSPTGQLVLSVVGLLYAAGLTSMVALARPPAPVRLLGAGVVEQ
jgi:tight adherence protein B